MPFAQQTLSPESIIQVIIGLLQILLAGITIWQNHRFIRSLLGMPIPKGERDPANDLTAQHRHRDLDQSGLEDWLAKKAV